MVKVIFEYDEETRMWDPLVTGAATEMEARQAFNAVVLTCQSLDTDLLLLSKVEVITRVNELKCRIHPAV